MDLKTKLETTTKNHQASIQNLEAKFDRFADKQSARPSGFLPSNTQPNPKGSLSKPYQPPQSRNEHVNVVFTWSGRSYVPPINPTILELLNANYGKFLKELVSNKHKLEQISSAFLRDESFALIQNKVPPKLGDPGSFLIPCSFNKAFLCDALADLGDSINLMPYSLHAKLSLETLKPTTMNGDPFSILPMKYFNLRKKKLNLRVGIERMTFLMDSAMKHSYSNDDTCFSIDVIDEILEEYFDALLDDGSKSLYSIEGTIIEEKLFAEFDEFIAMITEENSESESNTKEPPFKKVTFNTDYKIKTSLEELL
ncbi:hypothetical protein Tco_1034301 [Tanacetum coccineum]